MQSGATRPVQESSTYREAYRETIEQGEHSNAKNGKKKYRLSLGLGTYFKLGTSTFWRRTESANAGGADRGLPLLDHQHLMALPEGPAAPSCPDQKGQCPATHEGHHLQMCH